MFQTESLSGIDTTKSLNTNSPIQSTISQATMRVAEQLRDVPRIWNNEENVWMHTEGTIKLAKKYRVLIKAYHGSISRIIDLLQVHDIPEILTGDMDPRFTNSNTKFYLEEGAMTRLLSTSSDRDLWYEYSSGETLDAQFAKAFDKLQFLNELIKHRNIQEYKGALIYYRNYFIPFPELLSIIDNPEFSIKPYTIKENNEAQTIL